MKYKIGRCILFRRGSSNRPNNMNNFFKRKRSKFLRCFPSRSGFLHKRFQSHSVPINVEEKPSVSGWGNFSGQFDITLVIPGVKHVFRDDDTDTSQGSSRDNSNASSSDDLQVDSIRQFLAQKLGLYEPETTEERPPVERVLREVSLDGIVEWMKGERCKNIITLAGAGISTSAGIPDFRSPGSGLYHNLQKYNLPQPQAIFEINFFRQNPKPFFALAKELFPGNFKPTVSHYFIKLLHDKGHLLRHYTQNIDTLERGAGLPADKLVEAHGTFYTAHCLDCRKEYDLQFVKEHVFSDRIPICTECPGVVKPDIVFFGESLPSRFQDCLQEDFPKCDMLIIMGSSLEVHPFASLIDMVPDWCPRLLINREAAGTRSGFLRALGLIGGGLHFHEGSVRDVLRQGDCDDGCQELADKLGWGDELKELVASEHARLDLEGTGKTPHAPVLDSPQHD